MDITVDVSHSWIRWNAKKRGSILGFWPFSSLEATNFEYVITVWSHQVIYVFGSKNYILEILFLGGLTLVFGPLKFSFDLLSGVKDACIHEKFYYL